MKKAPGTWHYIYKTPRYGYQPVCGFGWSGGTWHDHWMTVVRGRVDCDDCLRAMGLPVLDFVQEMNAASWRAWSKSLTTQTLAKQNPFETTDRIGQDGYASINERVIMMWRPRPHWHSAHICGVSEVKVQGLAEWHMGVIYFFVNEEDWENG